MIDKVRCSFFIFAIILIVARAVSMPMAYAAPLAQAIDVQEQEVYHSQVRPGYACWTVLWHDLENHLYLAFAEKRRAPNTLWEPVPLDFWESMGLPVKYHSSFCNGDPNISTELVVFRSDDDGQTWTSLGRSRTRTLNAFSWTSLPDGRILRIHSDDYVAFDPKVEPRLRADVSNDGGNTWEMRAVLLEGYQAYSYRLKRLKDGTLVALAPYLASFGPGRVRSMRHTARPHVRNQIELTVAIFLSSDDGRTWTGPQPILPGINAWEADFVELPRGDLLFVNSRVQGAPPVRQVLRKTRFGFVPEPVFDVVSGTVPECLVYTRDGLLVGAVRNGGYHCSNDEGANWHPIAGLPVCRYQPYMVELSDGRLLCTWHVGGDNFFGELHQWVGSHAFRLETDLPQPTKLRLVRLLDESQSKYTNRYAVILTSGDRPVSGKPVNFAYHRRYTEAYDMSRDPKKSGTRRTIVTDDAGRAVLDLSELDGETNMHLSYRVTAWFEPVESDVRLLPCRSEVCESYALTMTKQELGW